MINIVHSANEMIALFESSQWIDQSIPSENTGTMYNICE